MLEAPADVLTLSTTIPLMMAISSTGGAKVLAPAVSGLVMLKFTRHPSFPVTVPAVKWHLVSVEAKRRSALPFLISVNGAHPLLFWSESAVTSRAVVFMLKGGEAPKLISHKAALVPPLRLPHT